MNTSDVLRPARFPDEPFDKYRARRRLAQRMVEMRLRGRLVYNSKPWGLKAKGATYRKPK